LGIGEEKMENKKYNKNKLLKNNYRDFEIIKIDDSFLDNESILSESIMTLDKKWKELIEGELLC
jgi:hypothetical protein